MLLDKGIRVIPGKSIKVKSGHVFEYIFSFMGIFIMFFLVPASLSVKSSIVFFTNSKSKNFLSFISSNSAYGLIDSLYGICMSLSSKGLLVTTPFKIYFICCLTSPLGRQFIPIIDSSTDDFPELCVPRTTIFGKQKTSFNPISLKSSLI